MFYAVINYQFKTSELKNVEWLDFLVFWDKEEKP